MTPEERANPDVIRGSRRRRIAAGSGTNVQAVKQLTKQFDQMRKMMKRSPPARCRTPRRCSAASSAAAAPMTAAGGLGR